MRVEPCACSPATGGVQSCPIQLGRVELGFQPDPSPCQVQKTQATMRVFVVAGGHAAPPLEPAEALFHSVARVVGRGIRAPVPGRNDGLNALLLQPRAEGVAVLGPVSDQAGPRRVRPGFH